MKSQKEINLNKKILSMLLGKAYDTADLLLKDPEIKHLQDYSNIVSIKRLNYNDHGPVHMRKVTINALIILDLFKQGRIPLNLEKEEIGTFEDSKIAVLLAAFLHDVGMSIGRTIHENTAAIMALPIIDRILSRIYPGELGKQVIIRSLALEGIIGHMATQAIHSLEAGVILIADGCDMEKGRARIPMLMSTESKVGDIHKYSSSAIEKVRIKKGVKKPVNITITMSSQVGFFQIEEVLLRKINSSPMKPYTELYAGVENEELKCYL